MSNIQDVHFDIYLAKIKAQSQNDLCGALAQKAAPLLSISSEETLELLKSRQCSQLSSLQEGTAICEIKSSHIKRPVQALISCHQNIELEITVGGKYSINTVIVMLSPKSDSVRHLQRVMNISRLFRSPDLHKALSDAQSEDEMQALFMPSQSWMIAA